MSNIEKIEDENNFLETYSNEYITIKTNSIQMNRLGIETIYICNAQKTLFEKLENRLRQLCFEREELKDYELTNEFEEKKNIYYQEVEKLKKDIERLENIPRFIVTEKKTDFIQIIPDDYTTKIHRKM